MIPDDSAETVFLGSASPAKTGDTDPPTGGLTGDTDATIVSGAPIPSAGGMTPVPSPTPDDSGETRFVATTPPPSGARRGPLEVGQKFGARYIIIKQLGVGGMGAVYQAWDGELGVAVALKVIRPEVTRDPVVAQDIERRFKQELLLARQVTHKNVVRIHDLGEIDGIKYITMPYIEGHDLATVLRNERLTVPKVMGVARQVAAGLQAAHEAGVVHRDLKPANVMMEGEHAIIMDFGIARSTSRGGPAPSQPAATAGPAAGAPALDDADAEMTRIAETVVGEVIGTIEYMAPEQARGEHVDQRADVYAFGLIIYDLLSGRRRSEHAVSAVGELQKRLAQPPPSIRTVLPDVPLPLDQLITKCTEPDAANRYQTTAELVAAIERLDDNGKLRPIKRVVRLPYAIAAAALLVTTSVGVWWYQRQFIPPAVHDPVSIVLADFQNNTGDPALDRTLEPVMKAALEGASFISVYDRAGIRSRLGVPPPEKLDERAAQELAVRQGVGVVLAGMVSQESRGYQLSVKAIRVSTGEVIASSEQRARSKDQILSVASDLASEVRTALGDDTSDETRRFAMGTWTASSLEVVRDFALAAEALSNGRAEEAQKGFSKAVERDPNFGPGFFGLAAVSMGLGRQQDAEKYTDEAVRHLDRMSERERFAARAFFYLVRGDYQACTKEYADLLARYAQDSVAHNNLALCYLQLRDVPKAVAHMREVVTILPKRSLYRGNLSMYAAYGSDFQTAEQEGKVALEMKNRAGWLRLAFANLGLGQLPQTVEAYQQLAKVDALGLSQSASGLGDLAAFEGRFADAIQILEKGASVDVQAKESERAADKFLALANVHLARKQPRPAATAAERALMLHPKAVKIRFMAARVFIEANQIPKAQALMAELAKERLAEPRAYAKILEGEMLLRKEELGPAIDAFTAANGLLDTWIGRYDLGRAYLQANEFALADSEFDRCLKRRGEALALFFDQDPSYSFLPPVYYYQGRAREGLKTAAYADSYRTYLNIRGKSSEDSLAPDARRRAGS